MFHIVNVSLQSEISKYSDDFTLGPETTTIINMLTARDSSAIKADFSVFGQSLSQKWQATCQRNLSCEVSGPNGIWKQAIVLDPFLKACQSQNLSDYTFMFSLVTDASSINEEFSQYLLQPVPSNPEVGVLEYWYGI